MLSCRLLALAWSAVLCSQLLVGPAFAWDPLGDITHPDRIVRNVGREVDHGVRDIPNIPRNIGREVGNLGQALDDARLEGMVQAGAPAFQVWLQQSRNTSIQGAEPMPEEIVNMMRGFYDDDVIQRARFRVGDAGFFNLAGLSIQYGNEVGAVTLIDVIVFRNEAGVSDPVLWAHELRHVQQFRDWGVRDFSIRYLRHWNAVEGEAYARQNEYANLLNQGRAPFQVGALPNDSSPGFVQPTENLASATMCVTQVGPCPLREFGILFQPCFCQGPNGIFPGVNG